jgi:hypothetical protein
MNKAPRICSEDRHLWNLKNECRICGMTRKFYEESGMPECRGFRRGDKPSQSKKRPGNRL